MCSFAQLQLIKAIANLPKLIAVYKTKADSAKAGKSAMVWPWPKQPN